MAKHRVIKTVGAITLSASLLLGGTTFTLLNKTKNYSDQNQIETIAGTLGCDLTYMKNNPLKKILRMEHNNGEPIYVSISDEYTETEYKYAIQSLDYIFGIVNEINSKYNYKIVDENERISHSKLGKTTIKYNIGELYTTTKVDTHRVNGTIKRKEDKLILDSKKPLYDSYTITYDREMHNEDSEESKQNTFLHELLHAFGFDDVYNTTANYDFIPIYCGHTFMNTGLSKYFNCLTPNDYRAIISVYAPKMNETELIEFIDKYKQKTEEYDETFYHSYASLCEYKTNVKSTLDTSKNYSASYTRQLTDLDGTVYIEKMFIEVKDGKYQIIIIDENLNILEQTTGETLASGNTIIFKNAVMKEGLRPLTETNNHTKYINDFSLMQNEKGELIFYNLADNDVMHLKDSTHQNENSSYAEGLEK